jgi:AcrR family transcriptional regulator
MARTRSENYDEIRDGILAAAVDLVARQGYIRTSIAELADACKLSRGALYHYFDSKEAILFAILGSHVRALLDHIEKSIAGIADPEAKFRRAIAAIVDFNAGSQNEQRILLYDLKFLSEKEQKVIQDMERAIVAKIADSLAELDAARNLTPRSKKVYTMLVFGMINFTFTWFDPKGAVTPAEFAEMSVQLFLKGFHSKIEAAGERRKSA